MSRLTTVLPALAVLALSVAVGSCGGEEDSSCAVGQTPTCSSSGTCNDAYDFEGIVAWSRCSASLIQFEGQPDTDQAYVLTNGHCYRGVLPAPSTSIYGRPSDEVFTLLDHDGNDAGSVHAPQAVYFTMTKTDVGLYRLQETYAQILEQYHIRALTLSSHHPEVKLPIEVISGFLRRGYTCAIDASVYELHEARYVEQDSMRYTTPGCETVAGTSGSPVIQQGTRTVVGINNTGNVSGGRCTQDNPCEVDEQGHLCYQEGLSYGQQTYLLYSCLNDRFEIDLGQAGCQLPH